MYITEAGASVLVWVLVLIAYAVYLTAYVARIETRTKLLEEAIRAVVRGEAKFITKGGTIHVQLKDTR